MTANLKRQQFEGSNTTTITTGNSTGGGSDALNQAIIGTGATNKYITTDSAHGGSCCEIVHASGQSTYNRLVLATTGARIIERFYLKLPATITVTDYITSLRSSVGQMCILRINTSKQLVMQNSPGSDIASSTSLALTSSVWYRVEVAATKGTGTTDGLIEYRYALASNETVVETFTLSGVNAGTSDGLNANVGRVPTSSTATHTFRYDSWDVDNVSSGWLGPAMWADGIETVTVAESGVGVTVTIGTASEPITVAESAAGVTVTSGAATETATVAESTTATTVTIGTAAELATVAESAAGSTVTLGTVSETVTIGESATGLTVTVGTASEPVTVAESTVASTVAGGSATGSEPITLAESAAGLTISTGTAPETVTVTETAEGQTTTVGAATEPITVTETATALTVTTGTVDETITVGEAAAAVTVFLVTLVETITLAESMAIAHDLDLTISIGNPRSTDGMFVGAPQISADVVGSPRTTTPATIGRGV